MIEADLPTIVENLKYIKKFNIAEYPKRDWVDAKESVENAEFEVIALLIHMNMMSEDMIKKIDIESWKEYRDSK